MTDFILPRRKFLIGAASLLAAPAVIRVAKLMAVRPIPTFDWQSYRGEFTIPRNEMSAYFYRIMTTPPNFVEMSIGNWNHYLKEAGATPDEIENMTYEEIA